jgi:hypothetical protein
MIGAKTLRKKFQQLAGAERSLISQKIPLSAKIGHSVSEI